ncbi:MAG: hypothetical protein Q7S40_10180 [Opitutaceae bacterium]|nr:hypothetical protein [Opitutaceae bacterium]
MRRISSICIFAWAVLAFGDQTVATAAAASSRPVGIALAIVFDTSGSMRRPPADPSAGQQAKIRIAQRSFLKVISQLESFARTPGALPLSVSVHTFRGQVPQLDQPLAPFDALRLRQWVARMGTPEAATPLGDAILAAGRGLLAADAISRHVLVLTDGVNTAGRDPLSGFAELQRQAAGKPVHLHLIALDMNAQIFAALRKQGATVIGAANEPELIARFEFILGEKVLVEASRE